MDLTYGGWLCYPCSLHLPLHALEAFMDENNSAIESNWNALIRFPTSNGAKWCRSFPLTFTCGYYMEIYSVESPCDARIHIDVANMLFRWKSRKFARLCQNFFHFYIQTEFVLFSRISFVLPTCLFLRFAINVLANVVMRYFLRRLFETDEHSRVNRMQKYHFENSFRFDIQKYHTSMCWRNSSGLQCVDVSTSPINLNEWCRSWTFRFEQFNVGPEFKLQIKLSHCFKDPHNFHMQESGKWYSYIGHGIGLGYYRANIRLLDSPSD